MINSQKQILFLFNVFIFMLLQKLKNIISKEGTV